jgi:hypothetical protein
MPRAALFVRPGFPSPPVITQYSTPILASQEPLKNTDVQFPSPQTPPQRHQVQCLAPSPYSTKVQQPQYGDRDTSGLLTPSSAVFPPSVPLMGDVPMQDLPHSPCSPLSPWDLTSPIAYSPGTAYQIHGEVISSLPLGTITSTTSQQDLDGPGNVGTSLSGDGAVGEGSPFIMW